MLLFAYRLALTLGHPYPEAMLEQMTATTLRRWMEYDQLSPFGDQRADLRMAIEAAAIVSSLSGKRQRPEDFMPRFRRPRQSLDQMKRVMQQFASATNRYIDGRN